MPAGAAHQGISLEKAAKAWGKVSVLVIMAAPRPTIAVAPSGSGCERLGGG